MSKTLPELGTIVFQTDGGGVPLPSHGIWEVWSTCDDPGADWPVELRRLTDGAPGDPKLLGTTQYRITPVLDHIVVDRAAVEEETRADERAKVLAELQERLRGIAPDGPPTQDDSFEEGYYAGREAAAEIAARIIANAGAK